MATERCDFVFFFFSKRPWTDKFGFPYGKETWWHFQGHRKYLLSELIQRRATWLQHRGLDILSLYLSIYLSSMIISILAGHLTSSDPKLEPRSYWKLSNNTSTAVRPSVQWSPQSQSVSAAGGRPQASEPRSRVLAVSLGGELATAVCRKSAVPPSRWAPLPRVRCTCMRLNVQASFVRKGPGHLVWSGGRESIQGCQPLGRVFLSWNQSMILDLATAKARLRWKFCGSGVGCGSSPAWWLELLLQLDPTVSSLNPSQSFVLFLIFLNRLLLSLD